MGTRVMDDAWEPILVTDSFGVSAHNTRRAGQFKVPAYLDGCITLTLRV